MEGLRNLTKHSTALVVGYCLIYLTTIYLSVGLNHSFWGDECHFYKTTLLFAAEPTLHTLQHYEEMSTPLPFILYAGWSKIAGTDISSLRVFSLIIAFFTFLSIFYLFKILFPQNSSFALFAVVLFSLIPYIPGLSIFIYTDLSAILFMVLAFIYSIKNKPLLFFLFSFAALLCRQYLIFFTIASLLFFALDYYFTRKKINLFMAMAAITANLSLLPLFYLWNGMSPNNELKKLYINEKIQFHPDAFIVYICYAILYTFPLYLILLPTLLKNKKIISITFFVSFIYWAFPLTTSLPAIEAGFLHIGLFHKTISLLLSSNWQIGILYQFLFFLSLLFFVYMTKLCIQSIKIQHKKHIVFSGITLLSFLAIMPFSYLTWEKYILPIMPFVYILFFETPEVQKIINRVSDFFTKQNNLTN